MTALPRSLQLRPAPAREMGATMRAFKFAVAATITIFVAVIQSGAAAKNRSCAVAEKTEANNRLGEIAADKELQKRLIRWHLRFGTPKPTGPTDNERILVQGGYVMDYDGDLRTALWTAYRLTAKDQIDAEGKDRVNCFRRDPRIAKTAQASFLSDYKGSGFDRGHMANDADLKDNLIEELNSYVLTNMSPQQCRFNRGIWLALEALTRAWASEYDTIYVTSGAIFDRNDDNVRDDDADAVRMHSSNGKERVAVPTHYYKVILRREGAGFKSIAFLLKHTNAKHGKTWAAVRPEVVSTITTLAEIEDKADTQLLPDLDRSNLTESSSGEGWDLSAGASNLEDSCP